MKCVVAYCVHVTTPNVKLPILTTSVDLQFAEIRIIRDGKLHDDVSVSWQARITTLVDYSCCCDWAWILTTQRVVPQRRCCHLRWNIRQTDDEVVRSECCTHKSKTIVCLFLFIMTQTIKLWTSTPDTRREPTCTLYKSSAVAEMAAQCCTNSDVTLFAP